MCSLGIVSFLAVLCGALSVSACYREVGVPCQGDEDCTLPPPGAENGRCLATPTGRSWCAYGDSECVSGMRYSGYDVADDFRGVCVAIDAGIPDPMQQCQVGTAVCSDGQLRKCTDQGIYADVVMCPLGCHPSAERCWDVDPANGLEAALDDPRPRPDLELTGNEKIDLSEGKITKPDGTVIDVPTLLISQVDARSIRVFMVKSLVLHDLEINDVARQGYEPPAFVADGPIVVAGKLSMVASDCAHGAPGLASGDACATATPQTLPIRNDKRYAGAGGGGRNNRGGNGGANGNDRGTEGGSGFPVPFSAEPLRGGCAGGSIAFLYTSPGYGGGAIQFVSRTSFSVIASKTKPAWINVGGGGGCHGAGGGSGGMILIEAPSITVMGPGAGLAAKGGGGGGCSGSGGNAEPRDEPAMGGMCSGAGTEGGNGFSGNALGYSGGVSPSQAGGGGGGEGLILLRSLREPMIGDGGFTSGALKIETIQRR